MDSMPGSDRRATFAVVLLLGLAACQPATGTVAPAGTASGLPSPGVPPPSFEASPSAASSSSAGAGQTDTARGRIWDALPAGFPTYPGSTPAAEAATGPASAVLAAQGADPKTIAGWMQSELERATYSTEALSGPLEDGSYVLDAIGPAAGCRVQVSIAPLGGLTTITVLYGAECPGP
jgi:hypothetical protein